MQLFQEQPIVARSRRNSLAIADSKINSIDIDGNLNVKQLEIEQVMEISVKGESDILSLYHLKQVFIIMTFKY